MKPKFDKNFISQTEADNLLIELDSLPWTRGTFMGHNVPRDEVWIGPYPYKFSGRTLQQSDWTPELISLKERIEQSFGGSYNSVLLNRYMTGKDSVSWHADDEPEMNPQHAIASISLGAERVFRWRQNKSREVEKEVLTHGSVLVMPPGFQQDYQHCVPKAANVMGKRINLTFRHMQETEKRKAKR